MEPLVNTITIITATLNCAASFVATADSIRNQTCRAVQWIVADGGSTDGTVDLIRQNTDVSRWLSEPDTGIYDAWNKACEFIVGDWVLFLGAGDALASPDVLKLVSAELAKMPSNILVAYGNVFQTVHGKERYRYGEVDLDQWDLYRPALPAHQGIFHRAHLLRQPAPFDVSYRVVADSKLLLQLIRKDLVCYMSIDVTAMEPGGISSNPKNAHKVMREFLRLEADLGYRIPRGRRLRYVVRTYAKLMLYWVAGARAVDRVIRIKQCFGGPHH